MIILKKISISILIFLGLFVIFPKIDRGVNAEQPKTKYDVDIYSQMITGYIADQNLEIILEGEKGIPETMIVLNEDELKNVTCDTTDPTSCDKIANVIYPQQNDRQEDRPITGQCQRMVNKQNPLSTKGKCKFNQSPAYSKKFIGTDSSGTDGLAVPGWQSYNHMFTANQCSQSSNVLTMGSHDMILPSDYQNQLRLSLLWRAFSTWINYQKSNNPHKELPVGGINWKEKVTIDGETLEFIDIYNDKIPGDMKPENYRQIWQTEYDLSAPLPEGFSQEQIDAEFRAAENPSLRPVPSYLQNSTWYAKWLYNFKLAEKNDEYWVKYFKCTPLYPKDTNAPALSIGSLVLALGSKSDTSGKYNFALHKGTLVDNYSARAATEGMIIEASLTNPRAIGKALLADMGKKIPLVANYFAEPRADVTHMPTALVFGNNNTDAEAESATPENTVTRYGPLTVKKLGSILDYPNRLYNPEKNPPPRRPKASEEDYNKQDANAVHGEPSMTNLFDISMKILLKVIPNKRRTYMIGESWSQASRFLELPSLANLMPSTELSKEYLKTNNDINVVVSKEGELFGMNERLSKTIKVNNSAFMPCKGTDRSDYIYTPRMIADGTAVNSCGQPSKLINTCSSTELPDLSGSDLSCSLCDSGLPPTLVKIFNLAATTYKVPASILYSAFISEGGDYRWDWTEANVKAWSVCGGEVPNCDSLASGTGARGPFAFLSTPKGGGKYDWSPDYSESSKAIDSGRVEFSPCNVIDATFAAAAKLAKESGGSGAYPAPASCWGHPFYLSATGPANSCEWTPERISTSMRQYTGYCTEAAYSGPGGSSGAQTSDNNHWKRAFDYYESYSCK
jgi:hypothetical protein